jgi:hypothetical protein
VIYAPISARVGAFLGRQEARHVNEIDSTGAGTS